MTLGFDFDKVFIDYPPFIPYVFVDYLYKGSLVFRKNRTKDVVLHYRFPGPIEEKVRILSHYPIFRHGIKENIESLKRISAKKNYKTYLVSSRFGFLRKRTTALLKRTKLENYFDGVYFNFENKQPHLFKEETIKKRLEVYHQQTAQLVGFYQQLAASGDTTAPKYARIEGVGSVEAISAKVTSVLK